ncbi:MAG: hypothetical protein Satyrvirus18_13 [Satyrvirus sp.]|uniref:Glycosyltransferase 2-like domain-containing protein n=1 Tax=Satyrvirus sp. TaxID=2487771 RepID=A0A3G5AE29_9VIRU|nr:MAG: hypothetical protein Satyrvirus18_13 [Satyrvirus sp.]
MEDRFCFVAIVRNESHIIKRCLDSISNIATSYIICDTGSTDGTPEIIKTYMKEKQIPGEVIHKEWLNYGYNKSYLMEQAYNKSKAKYIIWHDADEVFLTNINNLTSYLTKQDAEELFNWLENTPESITYIKTINGNSHYKRWNIVRNNQLYKWISPKHEWLSGTIDNTHKNYHKFILFARKEGSASRDILRCQKDSQLYLDYIRDNGGLEKCPREVFYLAQEYEAFNTKKAIKYYKIKSQLTNNWIQEVYITYLRLGRLTEINKKKIKYWKKGIKLLPERLECFHELIKHFLSSKKWEKAFKYGWLAPENREINEENLFIEIDVYQYKFDLDFSMAAYYSDKYELANNINQKNIMRNSNIDESSMKLLLSNQKFIDQKLAEHNLIKLNGTIEKHSEVGDHLSSDIRPTIIVVDNFYENPNEMREMALKDEFNVKGNYPGGRTRSYATSEMKARFEMIIGKKITYWPDGYNGSFQYTTSENKSWIHRDSTDYSAVIYLTPNCPPNSGTVLYRHLETGKQYTNNDFEEKILNNDANNELAWEQIDVVGNIYNRCILFNGKCSHKSNVYFGTNKYDGRLFQTFFFNTE